jgi:hypothetical protein
MDRDLEQLYESFEKLEQDVPACGPTRGPGQTWRPGFPGC